MCWSLCRYHCSLLYDTDHWIKDYLLKGNLSTVLTNLDHLFLILQTFTFYKTEFYQTFTAVNRKNILPFTDLPTSGVNFKNFTVVIFQSGKP